MNYEIPLTFCDLIHHDGFCNEIIKDLTLKKEDVPVIFIFDQLSKSHINEKYRMNFGLKLSCDNIVKFYIQFRI